MPTHFTRACLNVLLDGYGPNHSRPFGTITAEFLRQSHRMSGPMSTPSSNTKVTGKVDVDINVDGVSFNRNANMIVEYSPNLKSFGRHEKYNILHNKA